MKYSLIKYSLIAIIIFIASCSAPKKLANDLCDCFSDAGMKKGIMLDNLTRVMDDSKKDTCEKMFLTRFYDEMALLNNNDRGKYTKNFIKSMLDTECGDILFESIPYEELLESLKRKKEKEERKEEYRFEYDGLTICDCVNMEDDADEEKKEICSKMEIDWKEKYDAADFDVRELMIKEIEECN